MTINPDAPEEGIYFNVPEKVYREAKGVSQSELKQCEYSMLHFQTARTQPKKPPTDAQVTGTLLHALVLQRKELFVVIPKDAPKQPTKAQVNAKSPSAQTVEAVAFWKSFRGLHHDKEFITRDEADKLYRMRDSVFAHDEAYEMLSRSDQFEVAAFKKHHTGLMMKGLADCLTMDDNQRTVVPDLKTCQLGGASFREFQKDIPYWGYHRQAAYYSDLFGSSFFLFICVEKEPPYAVACYWADDEMIRKGRMENERDLMRVSYCEKTGIWPGYCAGIQSIGLPERMK